MPSGAQRSSAPARRLIAPARRRRPRTASSSASTCGCAPTASSGPLVCSFDFLENYFVAQGREWERYAWIKARALTGSDAHDELAAIVRPFVFRKYLDYATLDAMRALHAEVRREVERRELAEHVKLGPGGIREIEFVAQALQLVRGGRDPALHRAPDAAVLAAARAQRTCCRPPAQRARGRLRLPAARRASPAVSRRRAAPRPARRTRRTAAASRA